MPSNNTDGIYAGPPSNPAILKQFGYTVKPKHGSKEVHCSQCSQLMLIGPNIIAAHAANPYPFWCYLCLLKAGMRPDDAVPLGKGGHQYKEIDS